MTARLTAFYGLDPWRLLAELPMGIVRALSKMVSVLQAERSFEAADQIALGVNFAFEKGHTTDVQQRWREAVQPDMRVTVARATPERAARVGIGWRGVKHAR
jgi:hypothetical protein